MVINLRGEEFVEMVFENSDLLKKKYQISNYGRIISHSPNNEVFRLIKPTVSDGFNVFRYKTMIDGKIKNKSLMIGKLVGELFVEKTSIFDNYLIHLDYDNSNDHYTNLKWVNYEERMNHYKKNPKVIESRNQALETKKKTDGHKLSISDVLRIKKALNNDKRHYTLRQLAKKYKVSDMQIHRIKTGENWKHLDEFFNI